MTDLPKFPKKKFDTYWAEMGELNKCIEKAIRNLGRASTSFMSVGDGRKERVLTWDEILDGIPQGGAIVVSGETALRLNSHIREQQKLGKRINLHRIFRKRRLYIVNCGEVEK